MLNFDAQTDCALSGGNRMLSGLRMRKYGEEWLSLQGLSAYAVARTEFGGDHMAQVTNFFAGANSGAGFQNLFSQIVDLEDTYDLMVLKGGPGVGKATFMREVGRSMEQAGTAVEYLRCSGDPDSLDGVVLPELRCAVVDGTAPHVVEPRYPAAVDLQAHFDRERCRRRGEGIITRELRRTGGERGQTTRRFLGSITHKGWVWRFDSVETLSPKVNELADSWELASGLLERFRQAAAEKGWDTIACVAPEDPSRIEHLLIPGLGLGFVTSRPGMEYGGKPFRRVRLDPMAETEGRARLRFQTRMAALLREEGAAALKEAKAAHDALEAVYNPYVDFDGVRAQAALETGRLLSYLS